MRWLGKFVFLKLLIKIYSQYFSFTKKLGLDKFQNNLVSFIFGKKIVHVVVLVVAIFIGVTNIATANGWIRPFSEVADKTIISQLIPNEFSDYGNGQLITETASTSSSPQSKYLSDSLAIDSDSGGSSFDQEGDAIDNLTGADGSIIKPEMASTIKSVKARYAPEVYTVQNGDTLSSIAFNFGITVNTILWENNLTAYSLIRPGDKLTILQDTGVSYKVGKGETLTAIANKYSVDSEEIILANKLSDDVKLSVGQTLFIPGGVKYYQSAPKTSSPSYNPIAVIKDLIIPPASTVIKTGRMVWPTVGKRITQYFSWKHTGVDIANKIGTPVYAANSGTVTYAGWDTSGYGNRIDITGYDGIKTRYGHSSKLLVTKGQTVKAGDVIMLMGSTGRSTGPHLHFEVITDGVRNRVNPLNYIK